MYVTKPPDKANAAKNEKNNIRNFVRDRILYLNPDTDV